jgi:hypothetical protein
MISIAGEGKGLQVFPGSFDRVFLVRWQCIRFCPATSVEQVLVYLGPWATKKSTGLSCGVTACCFVTITCE